MREYEIVFKYINGCAGEAYPVTSFEEIEAESPEAYIKAKYGKDFPKFIREELPSGQIRFTYCNGTVTYIYEFTEL